MGGTAQVQFPARHRAIADQCLVAAQVRLGLVGLGGGIEDGGLALDDGRLCALALLQVVGQRRLLLLQLSDGLSQTLGVDAIIQAHQQIAAFDELEVVHRHLDDIAGQLWADDRHLATDQGVLGAFDGAAERRQAPGIEHQ